MDQQHTLGESARYSGIALHTGVRAHLTLKPAPAGSGVRLVRSDVPERPGGPALATRVIEVQRATTIAVGNAPVHTVEHVLAALYALGVDNAVVEMDGPEPPVADGSAQPFVDLIVAAGVVPQGAERQYCVIAEPLWVAQGDSRLVLLPYDGLRLACTVSYPTTPLGTQYLSLDLTPESFSRELASARTFCEQYDILDQLMKAGLVRGASLDNGAVVKDGAIVSKDGLRYPNEFVRHKLLDLVGDLSLIGRRLRGQVLAIKPGHQLNVTLAQQVMAAKGYDQEGKDHAGKDHRQQ